MATKKLTVKFNKARTAKSVVSDLKFHFEWKKADYKVINGQPFVEYTTKDGEKKTENLLYVNDIFDNEGSMDTFDEVFDYTFSVWGMDDKGNWFLGYED